jgi:hypothetical protein
MTDNQKPDGKIIHAVCAAVCSPILIHALYSIYIGYHPPISEFCTTNVTFTKINQVIVENPAILDLHNMLGESGKVIQLYRVEAITELVFIAVINVCLGLCTPMLSLLFVFALLICVLVFSILFIDLYFQNAIPLQCIDSLMGNNFAYYMMEIKVVLSIVALSILALVFVIGCCILLCVKLCGSGDSSSANELDNPKTGFMAMFRRSSHEEYESQL